MRAVVQRVKDAYVKVNEKTVGSISEGLIVYVAIGKEDTDFDAKWLADKISTLRIFPDEDYKMNKSIQEEFGSILVVSQFTLYADVRKGRRPSYNDAASPENAHILYEEVIRQLKATGVHIETGEYQAIMDVGYINRGPVTILIDSKKAF